MYACTLLDLGSHTLPYRTFKRKRDFVRRRRYHRERELEDGAEEESDHGEVRVCTCMLA